MHRVIFPNHSLLLLAEDSTWNVSTFDAHTIGCNAVSWLNSGSTPRKILASAGCDNLVRLWSFNQDTQDWAQDEVLEGHVDWVRDVAWAPNVGTEKMYLASCSQVR